MAPSQPSPPSLAELRRQIDGIDDALHDLIMRRAELVRDIRSAKPEGMPTIRLAREAQILRRLLGRHSGQFPRRTLVQMWQEMIDAFTWLQGSLRIAAPRALERLVRDQYGVLADIVWIDDPAGLMTLPDGASLAILPWPADEQRWWLELAAMSNPPGIVASLPFFADGDSPRALVLAYLPFEPSGDDCSLIVSRNDKIRFEGMRLLVRDRDLSYLFTVPEHVASDDARLDSGDILLGGYPRPYTSPS